MDDIFILGSQSQYTLRQFTFLHKQLKVYRDGQNLYHFGENRISHMVLGIVYPLVLSGIILFGTG